MADTHHNAVLGDLLIDCSRCLLQYVGECWPWTAGDAAERLSIGRLVARQQQGVARLAELLNRRRQPIDFGTYPTDFTDLHYLALAHLLKQLVDSEQALVDVIGRAKTSCSGDCEAVSVIEEIQAAEGENLSRLRELAAQRATGSAA